jgi:phage tail-like protein
MSAVTSRNDPIRQSRYALEIDGIIQAGFSEVTIPDKSAPPIEYREGNEKLPNVRKIPGLIAFPNIVLKWGITKDSIELHNWFKLVEEGKFKTARRDISILLLDEDGISEAARWEFREAWPTKYDAPDLNAKGNEVAIETLEIAHEGMIRKK